MEFQLGSTREAYGRTLVELGEEDPNLVVLCADLTQSTHTHYFAQKFPQRFFECGVAEQNMMGIAAGLAAAGKTVFASTFAVFAACRAFDQLRMCIAQPGLNVKIVATHGGITVGEDGFSHHAIEDLALFSSLPGFRIIVPADAIETAQAVRVAAKNCGPFYIRLSRPKTPLIHGEGYEFVLGKGEVLRQGFDASIIAIGNMVAQALQAAENLAQEGISCRVINLSTLKPIDEELIIQAAKETGAIVTVEEHLKTGGLGSAVAQVVGENHPVPLAFLGLTRYARSGSPQDLLRVSGLLAPDIVRAVHQVLERKTGSPL